MTTKEKKKQTNKPKIKKKQKNYNNTFITLLIKMDDGIVWSAMNHYDSELYCVKKTMRISTVECALF